MPKSTLATNRSTVDIKILEEHESPAMRRCAPKFASTLACMAIATAAAMTPAALRADDMQRGADVLRGADFSQAAEALRASRMPEQPDQSTAQSTAQPQSPSAAPPPPPAATSPTLATTQPNPAPAAPSATADDRVDRVVQDPTLPWANAPAQPQPLRPAKPAPSATSNAAQCPADRGRLAVERVVDIDAASGPIFGEITRRAREPSFLKPKEVVLTFDDGPMPWITRSILDTLDRYCAKATFFEVGRMAVAYPDVTREILARGHTVGGHTWSHPFNLPHMKPEKAQEEIEKGLSAVALAAGQPIAPFFRFTGLGDSDPLLAYLQKRGIASFTVDVVSDDSYINDANKLARITIERIESHKGGIVLFHDIKAATAKALPVILAALSDRGYKVVHMRAKAPLQPLPDYDAALAPVVNKTLASKPKMLPFFGAAGALKTMDVTEVAPQPRVRSTQQPPGRVAMGPRQRQAMTRPSRGMVVAQPGGWAAEVRPQGR